MKGFKKLLTGILAATMIMGASITAFATEGANASITITNENNNSGAVKEITYTYYQILKADVKNVTNNGTNNAEQGGTAAYYVEDSELAKALTDTGLFKVEQSSLETRWNVTAVNGVSGAQIVAALNNNTFKGIATRLNATGEFSNVKNNEVQESATATGLTPGYYLILSSLGTTAAVQTLGDVTINEKNTYPTIAKSETKDHDSMYDDAAPVGYKLEIAVPASVANKDIVVYDVASKGLTLNTTVTATFVDAEPTTYTWGEGVANADGSKFTYSLTIPAATVTSNAGKTITLTYTAVVNKNAVVKVPETNSAYLEYDNYKSAETEEVTVTTFGFDLEKIDGSTKLALTGAEFTLWSDKTSTDAAKQVHLVYDNDAKAYRVASADELKSMTENGVVKSANIVVDGEGKAKVIGLDNTSYYLQEEVAPTGYNKLTSRIAVTNLGNLDKPVQVENNSGSVLPSTGGIGTTIFYIIGGILIVAGVAYFLVKRKSDAE